jgi:UDP-N-acetylglucosamine 2-epimerase (non-hydrolysing)
MHIIHIVGARPNFIKLAPVWRALRQYSAIKQSVVHTGQHYDYELSGVFFQQLEIPPAEINLEVGSASHAQQTAQIMLRLEPVIMERRPDLMLVYGDVNSTMAAALVCSKLHVRVGHVEAGLRSRDRSMPEETNRIVTDQLSDFLFTPSEDGDANLQAEGISPEKIHRVGNVMIDSLVGLLPAAKQCNLNGFPLKYILLTLHRPSNVDDEGILKGILSSLTEIGKQIPIVFPAHPRTQQRMKDFGVVTENFKVCPPLSYMEFLALELRAVAVVTDSGGIQEETTYLNVPCLTVRENTERPITVSTGTNTLVGRDGDKLHEELLKILSGDAKKGAIPPLWDGHAGDRIAKLIQAL